MTIEKIITHPKYVHETYDYDLALIKLQSPLTYNNRVGPVCLPKFEFAVDTECYVKGWGHTEYGGNVSQVLLGTSGRRLWLTNVCALSGSTVPVFKFQVCSTAKLKYIYILLYPQIAKANLRDDCMI